MSPQLSPHQLANKMRTANQTLNEPEQSAELLLWSSSTVNGIAQQFAHVESMLRISNTIKLADLAYTLHQRFQSEKPIKLAIVAANIDHLLKQLATAYYHLNEENFISIDNTIHYRQTAFEGKIAFLFPGHGTQYVNMLSDLRMRFPIVQHTFNICEDWIANWMDRSLSEVIFHTDFVDETEKKQKQAILNDLRYAQPAIGIVNAAVYHLLRELGLSPDMAGGHSYGEYFALYASDAVDLYELITFSAQSADYLSSAMGNNKGQMLAVMSNAMALKQLIKDIDEVWIANDNSTHQVVLSGTHVGIKNVITHLESHSITYRRVSVSGVFHCPLTTKYCEQIAEMHHMLHIRKPNIPIYANKTGERQTNDSEMILEEMYDHFAAPVHFVKEIESMYKDGARIFVEVGPRGILSKFTSDILDAKPHIAVSVDQPRLDGIQQLNRVLGELIVAGLKLNLDLLYSNRGVKVVLLSWADETTDISPYVEKTDVAYSNSVSIIQQHVHIMRHFLNVQRDIMLTCFGVNQPEAPVLIASAQSTTQHRPHSASIVETDD